MERLRTVVVVALQPQRSTPALGISRSAQPSRRLEETVSPENARSSSARRVPDAVASSLYDNRLRLRALDDGP